MKTIYERMLCCLLIATNSVKIVFRIGVNACVSAMWVICLRLKDI